MAEAQKDNVVNFPKPVASMDELKSDTNTVEYEEHDGFEPGQRVIIGSLTAGDMLEWSEANEGTAKRTATLRLICKSLVSSEETGRVRYAADDKNIAVFRNKKFKDTERLGWAILKLNGMDIDKLKEAKKD